jgi:hypothetical protein
MPSPNLLGRYLAYQTGEHQASYGIPSATPGINNHSPVGKLTPPHTKNNESNKLKTSIAEGTDDKSTPKKWGEARN